MKLYAMPRSGNCYKVAWMLRLCKIPHEIVTTSTVDGATKSEAFKAKNPNGQVPLLELDDGRFLAESNAILLYLAESFNQDASKTGGTSFLAQGDIYQRAKTYEWMFFEQYSHEPSIAVRRANFIFKRNFEKERLAQLLDKGHQALGVMEKQLAQANSPFLTGKEASVADISLYAYTHVAAEGGFDMEMFPNVQAWVRRIQDMPGYEDMSILEQESFNPSN